MEKQNVRYCYALDKDGRLINIKDSKEMSNLFICPHCKSEMIGKYGQHNQWHFAHKKKQCDYDKYLHTLAEQRIMEWFNKSRNVNIHIPVIFKCPKYNQCKWKDNNCKKNGISNFDLKELFSPAQQEKAFLKDGEKYVADIFLNNDKNSDDPLFLEICVTHRCEQKKIDSGIKIIEFDIESESDIERIISSPCIEESENIRFYNFENEELDGEISDFESKELLKYVYPEPNEEDSPEYTSCHDEDERKGYYEVTIVWDHSYHFDSRSEFKDAFLVAASQQYPFFKSCVFCKHQRVSNCIHNCSLYKKIKGIYEKCRENNPMECRYYQKDNNKMSFLLNKFDSYKNKEVWINEIF